MFEEHIFVLDLPLATVKVELAWDIKFQAENQRYTQRFDWK